MGNATSREIKNELIYQKLILFINIITHFLKIELTIFFISLIFISFNDLLLIFFLILSTSFKHGAQPVESLFKSYSWEDRFKFKFLLFVRFMFMGYSYSQPASVIIFKAAAWFLPYFETLVFKSCLKPSPN